MSPTVAMAWLFSAWVTCSAWALAELAWFCAFCTSGASWAAPVREVLKSFWAAASAPSDCSRLVFGVGACSTLLISDGRLPSELGAVSPVAMDVPVVGSATGEIVGAVSAGESCQFQNQVM